MNSDYILFAKTYLDAARMNHRYRPLDEFLNVDGDQLKVASPPSPAKRDRKGVRVFITALSRNMAAAINLLRDAK